MPEPTGAELDAINAERERIRAEAVKAGIWPPPRDPSVTMLKMESTLAVPASWSPLR